MSIPFPVILLVILCWGKFHPEGSVLDLTKFFTWNCSFPNSAGPVFSMLSSVFRVHECRKTSIGVYNFSGRSAPKVRVIGGVGYKLTSSGASLVQTWQRASRGGWMLTLENLPWPPGERQELYCGKQGWLLSPGFQWLMFHHSFHICHCRTIYHHRYIPIYLWCWESGIIFSRKRHDMNLSHSIAVVSRFTHTIIVQVK